MARAKDKVVLGYVHPTELSAWFVESLLNLHLWDIQHDQRIVGRISRYSSANITNARNFIVETFLNESEADWLLMLDADMEFQPTLVDDILRRASRTVAPIVGGLCFGVNEGQLFPTLYQINETADEGVHMIRWNVYDPDTLLRVSATGAACVLMHREALRRIGESTKATGNTAYPWYQEAAFAGKPMGEDVTFCLRAQAIGIPVHVDTAVKLGHHKAYLLTEQMYLDQLRATVAEYEASSPGPARPTEPGGEDHHEVKGHTHG